MKDEENRFKKTRIISARAMQIAQGAPVIVKVPKGVKDPIKIAEMEFEAGVIPITAEEKDDKGR